MPPTSNRASARKKPKQERSAAMVEALIEAAARVFVKEGYAKATTNKIASAAGVSVGSLYQYFPSKDAIAVELLRRYRQGLIEVVSSRLSGVTDATFEEVVRGLLGDLVRAKNIDPALHRVLIEQVLRTTARKELEGFEDALESALSRALEQAQVPLPNRELAAFVLVRVVLGIAHAVVVDRPRHKTPELVDELTHLVVGYVRRPR